MLVHPESKSLLLRVRDTSTITSVIPKHKLVDIQGHNLAVRHGLDEVRVLRNLGMEAPSPILHYYKWPGRYKPFAHQLDTSAMLTLNPRAFVLNETGCVDATTEYLSHTGWKRIDQYDGGMVAQYDPKKGAEFVQPLEYIKKPCDEMIRFKTSRGVDQLLSAEHRVAYIASTGKFMVRPAHEVEAAHHRAKKGWKGRFITTFSINPTTRINLSDAEMRVQVAVIADGHFGKGCAHRKCIMRLKKERKKERIRALLNNAGIPYTETMPEYKGAEGFSVFKFFAPIHTKEFGPEFWMASAAQLQMVADEAWRWDGSERKAGAKEFCSTSKASADFVQYCFATNGLTASMSIEPDCRGNKPLYVVYARAKAQLLYLCGDGPDSDNNVRREPSTDGFKYCFEVPTSFLVLRRNGCIFITGNTGKSKSALWAADYLMSIGVVHKVLIMAKLSTLERVWMEEVFSTLMHRSAVVLHGDKERRTKRLAANVDFYIINHEGVAVMLKELQARKDIDLVICDEFSEYRNQTTSKFEMLTKLLKPSTRFWGMTATPCPNAPTDAYALAKLVNPTGIPQYYGQFKRETMLQVTQYKWVPRPGAYDIAYNAMQPAVRYRKADCLDLPPMVTEERECELSAEQKKAYERMRIDMVAEATAGVQITAVNAADKINKLRQILLGCTRIKTGEYVTINHKPRLNVLLECIQEAAAKVIVVIPFKGILRVLEEEVTAAGYSCGVLNGDISVMERNKTITAFKNSADPQVLLCHPKVMAHGLNLTEADMVILYGPIYSNDEFQQVTERINRPGQTKKMTVIRMGAMKLEFDIYAALDKKQEGQETILDMYKRIVQ